MFANITIGQYYPAESYIHSLDPRMKLLATIVYITALFFIVPFWGYLFAIIALSAVIYASKVPPKYMFKGLRTILFIIIFTAALNIFFTAGETVLFKYSFVTITLEGLIVAAKMAIRLVMLIVGSSVLTLTTTPTQMTDAIEYVLKPLKKIGVPAHEIAMMMTIALRFIPTLLEEMDKIMKAQMARGADFDTGGLIKKAKSLVPLLVPLFLSAFRRAEELATAMESRCYRGDINRTKMKVMKFQSRDYAALLWLVLFVSGIFIINYLA